MKKRIAMMIGIILIGFQAVIPLIVTNKQLFNETLPHNQASIVSVTDNVGNTWGYGTTKITCEVGEYYSLYSKWDSVVLSGKLIIRKDSVIIAQLDANTTNSEWLNITFLIRSEYIGGSGGVIIDFHFETNLMDLTSNQLYTITGTEAPRIPSSVIIEDTIVSNGGTNALRISWNAFLDNVGIAYYTIARKSASDGVLVSATNWDSLSKWNTSTNQFTDTSIDQDQTKAWYYGIKAFDRLGLSTAIYSIPNKLSLDKLAPRIDQVKVWVNDTVIKTWLIGESLNWGNNNTKIFPDGTFKIEVITNEELNSISCTLNNPIQERSYTISLTKKSTGTNIWEGTLDLKQPKTESQLSIRNGGYEIQLTLIDKMDNSNNSIFTNVFSVDNTAPAQGLDPMTMIIIAAVAGGAAAIAIIVVMKKKKNERAAMDSDVEISSGPAKKKKKGKIYSGASAIGRASGQEADMLQQRRGVKAESSSKGKTESASKPISSSPPSVNISRPIASESVKKPASDAIPESDKEIDALLKGSQQAGAMQMKQAENAMDIQRRMSFLKSKVDGADQNFALMNVILDQVKNIESVRSTCPTCGHILSNLWVRCPFCALNQNKDTVVQKMQTKKPIGQDMMCPVCKKIIKAQWSRCPYCFIKDKQG